MSLILSKEYPSQYPNDAVKVLNAMSFSDGKHIQIVGSQSLRSQQYAGDYDAMEIVEVHMPLKDALNALVKRFQGIIKRLSKMKGVYIGDIKSGSIEDWKATKQSIHHLEKAKIISKKEAIEAHKLLKDISPVGKLKSAKELKFHIIRWTPKQILAGKQTLRDGRTFTLQEAISSPTITKLDVIALVQNKYTDFSCIYEFHNNGQPLNPAIIDPESALKDDIKLLEAEGNRFKVIKRKFSLAKLLDNKKDLQRFHNIINSEAGKLYVVYSDVKTLGDLLESYSIPQHRVLEAISGFKHRLSRIYNDEHYLKQEPKLLKDMEKASQSKDPLPILRHTEHQLLALLNTSTKLRGGYVPY